MAAASCICGGMHFADGMHACGLGAARFLNISLGHRHIGDGDGEAG